MAGSGVNNTSALAFGGSGVVANTESWNGVVWTETNDLNTARDYLGGSGTETSALAYGENLYLLLCKLLQKVGMDLVGQR